MLLIHLGLLAAFGAGLLSFFSPCVFPLVPGYLSHLAGTSLQEAQSQPTTRWRVSLHALCFVLGFALLFTLLGAAAALLGSALHTYQQVLARVAGLLLIFFGQRALPVFLLALKGGDEEREIVAHAQQDIWHLTRSHLLPRYSSHLIVAHLLDVVEKWAQDSLCLLHHKRH